jgi:hypothetical protein
MIDGTVCHKNLGLKDVKLKFSVPAKLVHGLSSDGGEPETSQETRETFGLEN